MDGGPLNFTGGSLTSASATFLMPAKPVSIKAVFEYIGTATYTVTFMDGDIVYSVKSVAANTVLGSNWPVAPTSPGYTFNGWFDASGKQYTSSTVITGNILLIASWAPTDSDGGGDIGGGGSTGGGTTTSGATTTTPDAPKEIVVGVKTAVTQNSETGAVNATLTADSVQKAFDTKDIVVGITITIPESSTVTAETPIVATVSKAALNTIAENDAFLSIVSPALVVTFDADAAGTIARSGSGDIVISAGLADTSALTDTQ